MYTRCPKCYTVFALTDAQLAAKDGLARCGTCRAIFNASWHLTDVATDETAAPTAAPGSPPPTATAAADIVAGDEIADETPTSQALDDPTVAPELVAGSQPVFHDDHAAQAPDDSLLEAEEEEEPPLQIPARLIVRDEPIQKAAKKTAAPAADDSELLSAPKFSSDTSEWTVLDSEPEPQVADAPEPAAAPIQWQPLAETPPPAVAKAPDAAVPEPSDIPTAAEPAVVETPTAAAEEPLADESVRAEPEKEEYETAAPDSVTSTAPEDAEFEDTEPEFGFADYIPDEEIVLETSPLMRHSHLDESPPAETTKDAPATSRKDRAAGKKKKKRKTRVPRMQKRKQVFSKTRRRRGRGWIWALGGIVLACLALAQYVYFNFDNLAQSPAARPYLEKWCEWSGCTLAPLRDLSGVDQLETEIAPHPSDPQALRIETVLVNRASFAQPYPLLELSLSNRHGQTIARRAYRPDDYLGSDGDAPQVMPVNVAVEISFDIASPGDSVAGFEIDFRQASERKPGGLAWLQEAEFEEPMLSGWQRLRAWSRRTVARLNERLRQGADKSDAVPDTTKPNGAKTDGQKAT